MSSTAASSWWATIALPFVGAFAVARAAPRAAGGQRAGAVGSTTLRAGGRVAVDDLHHRRVDAELVGDYLGHAGLQALTVRGGAGVDGERAGVVHTHHRRLPQSGLHPDASRSGHP